MYAGKVHSCVEHACEDLPFLYSSSLTIIIIIITCRLEKPKPSSTEPKVFPPSASWDELRDHCIRMHPEACADVARLHPAEIFELRRRLSL